MPGLNRSRRYRVPPMCGICGLFAPPGAGAPDRAAVDSMLDALSHRGPDEGASTPLGACVLGHRRLRVIDLETGEQPVDGRVRRDRRGLQRRDLQLPGAARGAGREGPRDPRHRRHADHPAPVRGVRRALRRAARGHVRARALGRAPRAARARARPGRQEAAALDAARRRHARVRVRAEGAAAPARRSPRELDLGALDAFLALQYVPGPGTALRGVEKLPPGHVLVAERGGGAVERYWELEPGRAAAVRDRVARARPRDGDRGGAARLVADVPLGALLSGGIDSSIVVALMAQAPGRAGAHVHGRLRRRALRRALVRAAGRRALRHRARGGAGRARRCGAAAAARRRLRRAVRRRVGAADLLVSRGGAARRHGRARRRRRRRGLRRLRALPRARARRAARPGRARGVLRAGARSLRALPGGRREPRSTAVRAARFLEAARRRAARALRHG